MSKRVLLDTNILVYSRDEASPFYGQVCEAIKGLVNEGVALCLHRQILREYACVVTRPVPRGLGASIERVLTEIEEFEASYWILPDPETVWADWKRLVKTGGFTGLRLHDAFIAAAMIGHGISDILTLNKKDFQGIQEIRPFTPDEWEGERLLKR